MPYPHRITILEIARKLYETGQTITYAELAEQLAQSGVSLPDGHKLAPGRPTANAVRGTYNQATDTDDDRDALATSFTDRNGRYPWKKD